MGGKKVTVGYRFYLGVHAIICRGPVDKLVALTFEKRIGWTGLVTASSTIEVNNYELFGGDDREGGPVGSVDVCMGEPAQGINTYLRDKIGIDSPAYRGVLGLVFRGGVTQTAQTGKGGFAAPTSRLSSSTRAFLWSALNPFIKPVSVDVFRALKGWYADNPWYPAKAVIGQDANPAHIVAECLTNPEWGMGYPLSAIGAMFTSTADALSAEGFGLSLQWTGQKSIREFVNTVLEHIDASLFQDRVTGQFQLKLIRDDYSLASLLSFGPDDILEMQQFQRAAWGETVNELVVTYTNPETFEDASITVQDLANIRIQGAVVSSSRSYSGILSANLAYRVAERDLRIGATPLATFRFTANRKAWSVAPGDVIKVTWPEYKLADIAVRVTNINYGSLESREIVIEGVEDVFALPTNSYGEEQPGLWLNPNRPAGAVTLYNLVEATYFELANALPDDELRALTGDESFVIGMAARGAAQNQEFSLHSSPTNSAATALRLGPGTITPTCLVNGAVGRLDTTINFDSPLEFTFDGALGAYAQLDGETVWVEQVNQVAKTLTVRRGIYDTIPVLHANNARIWFFDGELGIGVTDANLYTRGATDYFWFTGRTSVGDSALTPTAQLAYTHVARWNKPWPPANVKINGEYFPTTIRGNFTITWVGRNRLSQTSVGEAGAAAWTAGNVAPEPSTTYTLEIYNGDTDVLLDRYAGLLVFGSSGSFVYGGPAPSAGLVTRYRVRLFATRDGVESLQAFEIEAELTGYGLAYDFDYGGSRVGVVLARGTVLPPQTGQQTYIPSGYWHSGKYFRFQNISNGSNGTITLAGESPDALSWTDATPSPVNAGFYGSGPIFAGGNIFGQTTGAFLRRYVAPGNWSTMHQDALPSGYSGGGYFGSVSWTGTQFVLCRNGGSDVYTTPDLVTWTHAGSPAALNSVKALMTAYNIEYVGGQYVARGAVEAGSGVSATARYYVATSPNLTAWTLGPEISYAVATERWYRFAGSYFAFGIAVVPGENVNYQSTLTVFKSADGVTWTPVNVDAVVGTRFRHVVVTATALEVLAGLRIYRTTNGATWTSSEAALNFLRFTPGGGLGGLPLPLSKLVPIAAEAGPAAAQVLAGESVQTGSKLLAISGLGATTPTLLFPSDAPNAARAGVFPVFGSTLQYADSGFTFTASNDAPRPHHEGFYLRKTGKRYFEVALASDPVGSSADEIFLAIGVRALADYNESAGLSAVMVNGGGRLRSYTGFQNPGTPQFSGSNGGVLDPSRFYDESSLPSRLYAGDVVAFEMDFTLATVTVLVNNVSVAVIMGVDTSMPWTQLFCPAGTTLELNIGQRAFTYSRPGTTAWMN